VADPDVLRTNVEDMGLSTRASNALRRVAVRTAGDLLGFTYSDLLQIKSVGTRSADEIMEALTHLGLSLCPSRTARRAVLPPAARIANLSPAALEVFWAFNAAASGKPDDWHYLPSIAAALRAVADQVVPVEISLRRGMRPGGTGSITPDGFEQDQRAATRRKLLAIAAELEGTNG
jgi:hypothetical protein